MTDLKDMPVDELIRKVESGDIDSCTYSSFTEYVKGMES